jgi:cytochrome c556
MLAANAADAQRLEDMLLADPRDAAMLSPQLARIGAGCKDCHVKWRD